MHAGRMAHPKKFGQSVAIELVDGLLHFIEAVRSLLALCEESAKFDQPLEYRDFVDNVKVCQIV